MDNLTVNTSESSQFRDNSSPPTSEKVGNVSQVHSVTSSASSSIISEPPNVSQISNPANSEKRGRFTIKSVVNRVPDDVSNNNNVTTSSSANEPPPVITKGDKNAGASQAITMQKDASTIGNDCPPGDSAKDKAPSTHPAQLPVTATLQNEIIVSEKLLISPTTNPSTTNNSNYNSPVLAVTDDSLSAKYSSKEQPSSTAPGVGNNEESKSKKKSRFTVKAVPMEVSHVVFVCIFSSLLLFPLLLYFFSPFRTMKSLPLIFLTLHLTPPNL
jgi:hypothetical protein